MATHFKEGSTSGTLDPPPGGKPSVGLRQSELTRAITELVTALESLPGVEQCFGRIEALANQVQAASTSADFELTRAGLGEFLELSRREILEQQKQLSNLISGTVSRIRALESATVPAPLPESAQSDPLTGLPSRPFAESELVRMHAQLPNCNGILYVVKRLSLINSRFGFRRGDQVLLSVVQHLAQAAPDRSALFRWTPCSFLALMPPPISYDDIRKKAQNVQLQKLTQALEWEGHTALVSVNLSARAFAFRQHPSADGLVQALDDFASQP